MTHTEIEWPERDQRFLNAKTIPVMRLAVRPVSQEGGKPDKWESRDFPVDRDLPPGWRWF